KKADGTWVTAGYMTGSGLPMQLVTQSGALAPEYQQLTELVDQQMLGVTGPGYAGLTEPQALAVSQQFIAASIGGYYSAVTMQAHTDWDVGQWLNDVLTYAQGKGVPIWTAQRWLNFTRARHDATIDHYAWDAANHRLSFKVTSSVGEPTLTILVPNVNQQSPVSAVTVDGTAVTPSTQFIKGVTYSAIPVSTGAHDVVVSYNASVTVTPTGTPTAGAGNTLLSGGFEEASFAAGGWSTDVGGTGSAAAIVTSPVFSGSHAARFTTTTQQNGEHAYVLQGFGWPASNVVSAQAYVQPQVASLQYYSKVFGLETRGPNSWTTRAGFTVSGRT